MTPNQHISDEILMSFAAGAAGTAISAVVAGHLDWCPKCRARLQRMEMLGALMMERVQPASISTPVENIGDKTVTASHPAKPHHTRDGLPQEHDMPWPVARYTGLKRSTIPFRQVSPGVEHFSVALPPGTAGQLDIFRVAPGHKLPRGQRNTVGASLIFWGSYSLGQTQFVTGDFAEIDDSVADERIAGTGEGCTYLVATESAARNQSTFARMLNPFFGR